MRLDWKSAVLVGAAAGAAVLLWMIRDVLPPFVAALVVAFLLTPLVDAAERRGVSRVAASLAVMVLFVLGTAFALVWIAPEFWRQLTDFLHAAPDYLEQLEAAANAAAAAARKLVDSRMLERLNISTDVSVYVNNMAEIVGRRVSARIDGVAADLWASVGVLLRGLSFLVMTPILATYALIAWPRMIAAADNLIPENRRAGGRALARDLDAALSGFVRGQAVVCLFDMVWYGVGLTLLGVNYALLIAVVGGSLAFIPYVGSILTLGLASSSALLQHWPDWRFAALAVAICLVGQAIEGNVVSPNVIGGWIQIPPFWMIFTLFAFGSLFGFVGLLVAVPCLAVFGVLLRFGLRELRQTAGG